MGFFFNVRCMCDVVWLWFLEFIPQEEQSVVNMADPPWRKKRGCDGLWRFADKLTLHIHMCVFTFMYMLYIRILESDLLAWNIMKSLGLNGFTLHQIWSENLREFYLPTTHTAIKEAIYNVKSISNNFRKKNRKISCCLGEYRLWVYSFKRAPTSRGWILAGFGKTPQTVQTLVNSTITVKLHVYVQHISASTILISWSLHYHSRTRLELVVIWMGN